MYYTGCTFLFMALSVADNMEMEKDTGEELVKKGETIVGSMDTGFTVAKIVGKDDKAWEDAKKNAMKRSELRDDGEETKNTVKDKAGDEKEESNDKIKNGDDVMKTNTALTSKKIENSEEEDNGTKSKIKLKKENENSRDEMESETNNDLTSKKTSKNASKNKANSITSNGDKSDDASDKNDNAVNFIDVGTVVGKGNGDWTAEDIIYRQAENANKYIAGKHKSTKKVKI